MFVNRVKGNRTMKKMLLLAALILASCGGTAPAGYNMEKILVPGMVTIVEFTAPW